MIFCTESASRRTLRGRARLKRQPPQFTPRGDPDVPENVAQVALDRISADIELLRNLGVREPFRHEDRHVPRCR
jgi:hypothetical protein